MKKLVKYTVIISLTFILFTQVLDVIGWLSDEKPLYKSAVTQVQEIDSSENGYLVIKFMSEPGFQLLNKRCNNTVLDTLLSNEQWDNEKAQSILKDHLTYQTLIPQVNAKKFFQSEILESYLDDLPPYSRYGELFKLKLLESRSYAENQDIDKAIISAEQALVFSQRIKGNMSPTLISFLVGISYQDQALGWIHRLGTGYNISYAQREKILDNVQQVSDFNSDNFDAVIGGEFYFSESILKEIQSMTSLEGRTKSLLAMLSPNDGGDSGLGVGGDFFLLISPHFFFQKEKISNAMYEFRAKDITFARTSCRQVDYSHYSSARDVNDASFFDLFKLNSIGSLVFDSPQSLEIYFLRRCLADFHFQAVKTALAITQFESINNRKIKHLQELSPSLIEAIPIDATTNESLSYNPEKRWIYSKGTNFVDDLGSLDTVYSATCYRSNVCKKNPTVPVMHMITTQYE